MATGQTATRPNEKKLKNTRLRRTSSQNLLGYKDALHLQPMLSSRCFMVQSQSLERIQPMLQMHKGRKCCTSPCMKASSSPGRDLLL
jgi:hypothetical protein